MVSRTRRGPLHGVRVLELHRYAPGQLCGRMLADLGAEVIVIEEPGAAQRESWAPPGFIARRPSLLQGKQSLEIDLKQRKARPIMHKLLQSADVLVLGLRPSAVSRLGLSFQAAQRINPRLVYCSIHGFPPGGNDAERPVHDLNVQGLLGLLTQMPDGMVAPPGQYVDVAAGFLAVTSILATLVGARQSRKLTISLSDSGVALLQPIADVLLAQGRVPPVNAGALACYRAYSAHDGRAVTVAALEPRFWRALCQAMDLAHLADCQYSADQTPIVSELAARFAAYDRDEWLARLAHVETCVAAVRSAPEVVNALGREGFVQSHQETPTLQSPLARLFAGSNSRRSSIPSPGADTSALLRRAGYSKREIRGFAEQSIIGGV